jgi:hypothetical protein
MMAVKALFVIVYSIPADQAKRREMYLGASTQREVCEQAASVLPSGATLIDVHCVTPLA